MATIASPSTTACPRTSARSRSWPCGVGLGVYWVLGSQGQGLIVCTLPGGGEARWWSTGPFKASPGRRQRAMAAVRSQQNRALALVSIHAASCLIRLCISGATGRRVSFMPEICSLNTFWPVLLRQRFRWRASVGSAAATQGSTRSTAADQCCADI